MEIQKPVLKMISFFVELNIYKYNNFTKCPAFCLSITPKSGNKCALTNCTVMSTVFNIYEGYQKLCHKPSIQK